MCSLADIITNLKSITQRRATKGEHLKTNTQTVLLPVWVQIHHMPFWAAGYIREMERRTAAEVDVQ